MICSLYFFLLYTDAKATQTVNNDQVDKNNYSPIETRKIMGKKLVDPNKLCMGCMEIVEDITKPCPKCGFVLSRYQKPANSMPPYEILNGKYLIGSVIGIGGFGITYVGWDFYQSKRVCIKEYFPRGVAARDTTQAMMTTASTTTSTSTQYSMDVLTTKTQKAVNAYLGGLRSYINEAKNLSRFYALPGIVSIRDFFYGNRTAYIVMEYIEGINLRQYAKCYEGKRIPANILLPMLKDVIIALNTVHKENIIHRDISPDNIMINKKFEVKVIDFGAAKEFHGEKDNAILLKHGYAPIEQYDRNGNQGPWTDVYSLSASIYYLLSHVKLQKAFERVADDQLQSLRALGIPISERQDMALLKGMSVQIKDRFQSMADLYYALYGECIPGEKVPLNWQAEMQQRQNEQMSNGNVYMTDQISNDNVNTTNQSSNESIYTVNQMSNDNTNTINQASNGSVYTTNQAPNDHIYTTNQAVIERIQPTEPEYQNYPGRQKADGNEPVYQSASVSDRYIPDKSREEAAMEYLRQQLDNQ